MSAFDPWSVLFRDKRLTTYAHGPRAVVVVWSYDDDTTRWRCWLPGDAERELRAWVSADPSGEGPCGATVDGAPLELPEGWEWSPAWAFALLAPELSDEERLEAEDLVRELTAFASLDDLVQAPGHYRPTLIASPASGNARKTRRLAALYDQAQRARGDKRRAST